MDYTHSKANEQLSFFDTDDSFLKIPSRLEGFNNSSTEVRRTVSGREVFCFHGTLDLVEQDRVCPVCGKRMHINKHRNLTLRHLCFGGSLSAVSFDRVQLVCECGHSHMQKVPFKAEGHQISVELYQYTRDLLALGTFTLKQVAEVTGLGKNIVKDIDMARLKELYTIDGTRLKRPEKQARMLAIDEFKLHKSNIFATHIIDLDTGHILWIARGRKKQVVYDFINHVGMDWMDSVEAVACDMNSDFQEAFEEKCPWIQIVFDHFHIVKYFNAQVVSEVRRDEQKRLNESGFKEEAKALKKTRYILMASRSTLQAKDAKARAGEPVRRSGTVFPEEPCFRKEGYEAKYDELLRQNRLLFTIDLIKERLALAYTRTDEVMMAEDISSIMDICTASRNSHLYIFGKLLSSHFEGIIAHATYRISTGKMEGINNKIKVIRRQAYGLPDDDYFFLRLFDASRKEYVRNPPSHKFRD